MRNLILVKKIPLQMDCGAMAFDGQFFYVCQKNEPVVYRLDLCGNIMCAFTVGQRYQSICYDSRKGCFWGIGYGRINKMICLDQQWNQLREVGLALPNVIVNHIGYRAQTDTLLLNTYSILYEISKKGTVLSKSHSALDQLTLAAGELAEDILTVSNAQFTSPDVIKQVDPAHGDENITCLPQGHRCYSFCPGEQAGEELCLYLLTRDEKKAHLLKYLYSPAQPGYRSQIYSRILCEDSQMVCIQEIII